MRSIPTLACFVCFLALVASDPTVGQQVSRKTPEETVDAFHRALDTGDREAALAYLAPKVVIFEGGGAEMSREEYAHHHLEGDMKFSAAVTTEVTDRRSGAVDGLAWVLTRSRTRGTYNDRTLDLVGTETMLLRPTEEGWTIVHIHWSSRAKG